MRTCTKSKSKTKMTPKKMEKSNSLICPICGFKGKTTSIHRSHLKIHGNHYFRCTKCDYKACSMRNVERHSLVHEEGMREYTCRLSHCNFSTKITFDFKRHKLGHEDYYTRDKPYTCGLCNDKFKHQNKLEAHIRMHTGEKPFSSKLFDYTQTNSKLLIKLISKDKRDREKPFGCTLCSYRSKFCSGIRRHLSAHLNSDKFSSQNLKSRSAETEENSSFESASSAATTEDHADSTSSSQDSSLEETTAASNDTFPTNSTDPDPDKSSLSSAAETSAKGLPVTLRSTLQNELQLQLVTSKSKVILTSSRRALRKFSCEYCYRKFAKEMNLLSHLRCHTGVSLYRCLKCPFKTTKETLFYFHEKQHEKDAKQKLFGCRLCQFKCLFQKSLVMHISLLHKLPIVLLKKLPSSQ